ncbi:MAG: preprotein translocase subunit SecE [Proteobacteria bacterium]|nr:preprotein translocase subunit SecE [Pseudomonadota bacterium]
MSSSPQVETVATGAEKALLAAAALLLVAGVAGYYLLQDQGLPARLGALAAGIVLSLVAFFTSHTGKRLIAFSRDSWREVGKVVWPTRKEAGQMTLYVFAFVVAMALFLWLTDKTLEWVLYDLVLGWRK